MDGSSAPHSETPSRCSVTLEFDVVPASKSVLTRELSGDDRDPEKCASDDYHDEQSQSPVTWDGDDDPENPQNWSTPYKWLQTVMVAVMTINV
jgi:hypothetical protein